MVAGLCHFVYSSFQGEKTTRRKDTMRKDEKKKLRHAKKRKDATQKDDTIKVSNGVFSHGIFFSSFRAEISSFLVPGRFCLSQGPISSFCLFAWRFFGFFRLFAWRFFVFSSFCMAFFCLFVFLYGIFSSFRLFACRFFIFSRCVFSPRREENDRIQPP